jgi:hypothetical protein
MSLIGAQSDQSALISTEPEAGLLGFVSKKDEFVSKKDEFVAAPIPSAEPSAEPAAEAVPPAEPAAVHPLARYGAMKIIHHVADADDPAAWLWDGYVVRGGITQLTSRWKSGKTTLLSVLLDRLREGGVLFSQPVQKARVVVLSEESPSLWRARAGKLTFGESNTFLCRPFRGKPRPEDWTELIDRLVALHGSEGLDLVVIDPVASFLPGRNENSATVVLEVLAPLQRLTALGVAVLLFHHPRKHNGPEGTMSRGSGALMAHVDIYIEMEYFDRGDERDRRRRLHAFSRFEQTPRHVIVELNEAGTEYALLGDVSEIETHAGWERLRRFLESAPCKLSREEMLEDWPAEDRPAPTASCLWKWLDKAVAEGRLAHEGAGTKKDPFLYWIPGKEVEWPDDPLWFLRGEIEPFDPGKEEKERIRQDRRERAKG